MSAFLRCILLSQVFLIVAGETSLAGSDEKSKPPRYIYNPRKCTGPKLDQAAPLLAPTAKSEVNRAGWAHKNSRWATPANTCNYTGYYVGGGGGYCGKEGCRPVNDGTWGWDFQGRWIPRIVSLDWTWPRRYQGGTGKYAPDGPKFPSKTPETLFAPP